MEMTSLHVSTSFMWRPNAGYQARRTAGARYERTLFAVAWMPVFGAGVIRARGLPTTAFGALTRLLCLHTFHNSEQLGRRVPRLTVRPPCPI